MIRIFSLIIAATFFLSNLNVNAEEFDCYTWQMDESQGTGSVTTAESPGISLNLTRASLGVAGKSNTCIELNQPGTSTMAQYAAGTDPNDVTLNDKFTISVWVYPYNYSVNCGYIIAKDYEGGKRGWGLLLHPGYSTTVPTGFRLILSDAAGAIYEVAESFGPTTIEMNVWHHVAVTWDMSANQGAIYGYVDGVRYELNAKKNTFLYNIAMPLQLGRYKEKPDNSQYAFDGMIDQVRIYGRSLTEGEILELFTEFDEPVSYNQNIVSHYTMDDDFSDGFTDDEGPNSNDGTIFGGATADAGVNGNAIYLDGVNNYISLGDRDYYSFGDGTNDRPFSGSAWINMYSIIKFRIFNKSISNSDREWMFYTSSTGQLSVALYDVAGTVNDRIGKSMVDLLDADTWYHVAFTYDGSGTEAGIRIYVNGAVVTNTISASLGSYAAMANEDGPLEIGAITWLDYSHGLIDDARIYSCELNAAEVQGIYTEFNTPPVSTAECAWMPASSGGIYYNEGNVGIGTTNPARKFEINNGTNATRFTGETIEFSRVNNPSYIRCIGNGGALSFITNNRLPEYLNSNFVLKADMNSYFNGNVGVGTASPTHKLHVNEQIGSSEIVSEDPKFILDDDGMASIKISNSSIGYAGLRFNTSGSSSDGKLMYHQVSPTKGLMLIGCEDEIDFEMKVKGTLTVKKIKVTQTGWADFVFDPSYKLASLREVEHHIQQNKHLPEIPSAKEVAEDGVDVGQMQAKLLQKVEELTLYLIEQDKRIEKLEKENQALRNN